MIIFYRLNMLSFYNKFHTFLTGYNISRLLLTVDSLCVWYTYLHNKVHLGSKLNYGLPNIIIYFFNKMSRLFSFSIFL